MFWSSRHPWQPAARTQHRFWTTGFTRLSSSTETDRSNSFTTLIWQEVDASVVVSVLEILIQYVIEELRESQSTCRSVPGASAGWSDWTHARQYTSLMVLNLFRITIRNKAQREVWVCDSSSLQEYKEHKHREVRRRQKRRIEMMKCQMRVMANLLNYQTSYMTSSVVVHSVVTTKWTFKKN